MPPTGSKISQTLARNRVGTVAIVFMTVSAAAPLTVIGGGAVSGFAVSGTTGIPVGYLAIALVLALFAVGFTTMARHIPNAGSFYAYVSAGLGKVPGVAAAGIAVLAYNVIQVAFYGGFGVAFARTLSQLTGLPIPWWSVALVAWALIAVLGLRKVDISGRILGVLLTAEILVVIVFDVVYLANPAGGTTTVDTLSPMQLMTPAAGVALVIAFTGNIGFESPAVFSEEAKDRRRTVARATYIALAVIGVLYAVSTWALTVATGPDGIVAQANEHDTDLLFFLAGQHLPAPVVLAGEFLFATSLFAGLLAWHNVSSRYHFALGREGVLPRWLGATNPMTGAPRNGSLVQSAFALVIIVINAVVGLDPTTYLFFWGSSLGALGVLVLITATSASVIGFFARRDEQASVWRTRVAPGIALLVLGTILVLTVITFDQVLGTDSGDPAAWILPGLYVVVAVAGAIWARTLRNRQPEVWRHIGAGTASSLVDPTESADGRAVRSHG